MDTVMQAIFPNTPFSHSISLNPLGFIDELFQRANKYSMLEDDLRVATKQGGLNLGCTRDSINRWRDKTFSQQNQ